LITNTMRDLAKKRRQGEAKVTVTGSQRTASLQ